MPGTYEFAYEPTSPYAHAVALLSSWRVPEGEVVVDLGCGYGAVAGPIAALGLSYLGVDADPAAVEALRGRGMEAVVGDLADPAAVLAAVSAALGGRRVAALCALDALEHLANAAEVLLDLSGFAREAGDVPLVVSIPNVTHRDLAAKLLLGRWDVTPTGLLDRTHLRFFSPDGLRRTMSAAGWDELESFDFAMPASDQHFPADCVALQEETPIGALLQRVRWQAAPGAIVNQFVRAYRPVEPRPAPEQAAPAAPFLSVVVRTDGTRPATFDDMLVALAGQDDQDFEVVVVPTDADPGLRAHLEAVVGAYDASFAERVRVVATDRALSLGTSGNLGLAASRGRYVALFHDGHVPFGHWVSSLARACAPGRVVHCGLAVQTTRPAPGRWRRVGGEDGWYAKRQEACDVADRPRPSETGRSDLLDLLGGAPVPICGFALPRSLFDDLGERYDEDLPALEDWDLLLRAVERCGVVSTGTIGVLCRAWLDPDAPAAPDPGAPERTAPEPGAPEPGAPEPGAPEPGGDAADPARGGHRALAERAHAAARAMISAKWDAAPLLLERGSARRLACLMAERARAEEVAASTHAAVARLEAARAEAERRIGELHASTSWRVTAPLRRATTWWRGRREPPP